MSDRFEHEDVEVRRDGPLAAVIGIGAAALAIAYLARASGSDGGWLDWVLMAVLGGIAALYLTSFLDARAPLLLADQQGIRMRSGRSWRGVAWTEVDRIEHLPRSGLLRDGRIMVITGRNPELTLRLSLATRLVGADWDELTDALRDLAGSTTEVVELEPFPEDTPPDDGPPSGASTDEHRPPRTRSRDYSPSHLRRIAVGVRAEMRHLTAGANALKHHPVALPVSSLPEVAELQRDPDADWVESVVAIGVVADPEPEPTEVIEDLRVTDPVIGPELAAARRRLSLSVDQLAERTRIRPHVIESIEIDDFAPCGGDFYARGHLRTLARVLGTGRSAVAAVLRRALRRRTDRPAPSVRGRAGHRQGRLHPRHPRRPELVGAGGRRDGRHPGLVDRPPDRGRAVELGKAPVLNGSPSHGGQGAGAAAEIPVVFTAAGGGAKLKVRDGQGDLVFDGELAFGQSATLDVSPPVRVSTSDGSVTATIDGEERGALGDTGHQTSGTYAAE